MKKWFKWFCLILITLWCLLIISGLLSVAIKAAVALPPPPPAPTPLPPPSPEGVWSTVDSYVRQHPQLLFLAALCLLILIAAPRSPPPPMSDWPAGPPKDWRPCDVMEAAFTNDDYFSQEPLFISGLLDWSADPLFYLLLVWLLFTWKYLLNFY